MSRGTLMLGAATCAMVLGIRAVYPAEPANKTPRFTIRIRLAFSRVV
jgi:hypothetical protein